MHESEIIIILVIVAATFFDVVNGWHDAANAVATVISTRVLSPTQAILLSAFLNLVGAFISTAVAKTVGGNIINPEVVTMAVVLAGILSAISWNIITLFLGLPISSSHALIGGLIGSAYAFKGFASLQIEGILTILATLFISPILGFIVGLIVMVIIAWSCRKMSLSSVNKLFGKLQLLSVSFMALSHGTNDAQKAMGVIVLALFTGGYISTFEVPFWVVLLCAIAMAMGTAFGGWRIIKTLGMGLLKLKPVHGFAAETSAALVLSVAANIGLPVSTTHVITSSILGVGSTIRLKAVQWGLGKKILYAWLFTLPLCILMGMLYYLMISLFI